MDVGVEEDSFLAHLAGGCNVFLIFLEDLLILDKWATLFLLLFIFELECFTLDVKSLFDAQFLFALVL